MRARRSFPRCRPRRPPLLPRRWLAPPAAAALRAIAPALAPARATRRRRRLNRPMARQRASLPAAPCRALLTLVLARHIVASRKTPIAAPPIAASAIRGARPAIHSRRRTTALVIL